MSIYATLWQNRLRAPEWDILLCTQHGEFSLEDGDLDEEHWVEITFQGVPGHIGHPSYYPGRDPYASFLPPVVDDPEKLRAVVVVQEGWKDKDVQRYVDPLLTLSGDEYQALSFDALMRKIYEAMKRTP